MYLNINQKHFKEEKQGLINFAKYLKPQCKILNIVLSIQSLLKTSCSITIKYLGIEAILCTSKSKSTLSKLQDRIMFWAHLFLLTINGQIILKGLKTIICRVHSTIILKKFYLRTLKDILNLKV